MASVTRGASVDMAAAIARRDALLALA
jgi:hypothetical protein